MVVGCLDRLWRTTLLAARWGPGVFTSPGMAGQWWFPGALHSEKWSFLHLCGCSMFVLWGYLGSFG